MPAVFSTRQPGVVAVVKAADMAPFELRLLDFRKLREAKPFVDALALVRGFAVQEAVNRQWSNSVGHHAYLTLFGDRPTRLSLEGLAFAQRCGSPSRSNGVAELLKFWQQWKANAVDEPLVLTVGGQAREAWLMEFTASVRDPELQLASWTMELEAAPYDGGVA